MTTSLLRHRLEVSFGDVPSDRSTFYYRYVGGFVATGWAAVVRVGPWRRTPQSAFAGFLSKVAEVAEDHHTAKTPYALAEKVFIRLDVTDDDLPETNVRACEECDGTKESISDFDPETIVCPSCGGGGTAFHEEVVAAEQLCLAASDSSCPPTQPAPPEKV